MTGWGILLVWLLLLALLALEFALGAVPGAQFAPPIIGVTMALLVSMAFMRLASMRGAAAIFAMAGVFWLCVLMGMGSLDPATRRDVPTSMQTKQ